MNGDVRVPDWIETSHQLDAYIEQLKLAFNRRQYIRSHPNAREEVQKRIEHVMGIHREWGGCANSNEL